MSLSVPFLIIPRALTITGTGIDLRCHIFSIFRSGSYFIIYYLFYTYFILWLIWYHLLGQTYHLENFFFSFIVFNHYIWSTALTIVMVFHDPTWWLVVIACGEITASYVKVPEQLFRFLMIPAVMGFEEF